MRKLLLVLVLVAAVGAVGAAAFFAVSPGDSPASIDESPERREEPPAPEAEEGKVRISGAVFDEAGEPLTGAFVYLLKKGYSTIPVEGDLLSRTDAAGTFTLAKAEESDLDLIAISPGFRPHVIEHASGDAIRVELARGGSIRGRVVDDRDRPVVGAAVVARSSDSRVSPPRGIYLPHHETLSVTYMKTITGLGGDFVIHGVGEAEVDLTAEKRGYPELLRAWRGASAGDADVKLVLLRPFVASVFVVDADRSEPLASAGVVVMLPDEEMEVRGRTGRSGEMRKKLPFPAARAPDVRVTVTAGTEDYGSIVAEGVLLSKLEEGEGFTLRLAKREPAVVRLTVRYDTGKPYSRWMYFEVEPSFGEKFNRWSRIDKEGAAVIQLPPGHYKSIQPRASGELVGAPIQNLKLDPAEEIERTITIVRGGDLQIEVVAGENEPVRGVECLVEHEGGTLSRTVWGRQVWFVDVPPGPATVTVTFEGYETVEEKVSVVKDDVRKLKLTLRRPPKRK